ncbi:hypothetical protein [Pedobacter psychroterrae]|uniref:Uncharacterized protein n=1 Tax=Pedobacter psychroterrae TaxID=2530453 RepID=A0A4R0NKG6_9SPHI|nr:hypothetical protein [Pedobacter psychroterrae]TCD01242.1 hypothetical protein EZ437_10825 [Pedobacter psychroterrae]
MIHKIFNILIFVILMPGYIHAQGPRFQEAYERNSPVFLEKVIAAWAKEIRPKTIKERSTFKEHVRQGYAVFEAFFDPKNLAQLGGSQIGYDAYLNDRYAVIVPQLNIYQADKVYYSVEETKQYTIANINKYVQDKYKTDFIRKVLKGDAEHILTHYGPYGLEVKDSTTKSVENVLDFRPRMLVEVIPLYLTEKYDAALRNFLGNETTTFGQSGNLGSSQATGGSLKRINFLKQIIKVFPGHWGGNWELATPPKVNRITFDKEMRYAMISYELIYEGGRAFMEYKKGKWELITAKRTWQE